MMRGLHGLRGIQGSFSGGARVGRPVPPVTWEAWGHSFVFGLSATGADTNAVARFARMAGVGITNRGVSGAVLGQDAAIAGGASTGNWTQLYRALPNGNPNALNVVMMWGINDLIEGTAAAKRLRWKHALRGMICLAQQKARYEDSDASWTWPGGYVNTADATDATAKSSGTSYRLATSGSPTASFAVPSGYGGGGIQVGAIGRVAGATYTFTLDGGAAGSLVADVIDTNVFNAVVSPHRITAAAGAHTVSIATARNPVSGQGRLDWWAEEHVTKPLILVNNVPRPPTYPAPWNTIDDTQVAAFNTDVADVVAEFGSNVVLIDADAALDKDPLLFGTDQFHPNDAGHAVLSDLWLAEL